MSNVLRAVRYDDLPSLYAMAKRTGGGFTNLPPDEAKLADKLDAAAAAFARDDKDCGETRCDDRFMFVLEDHATGTVHGTCQVFARIGATWPFYSYRIDQFDQYSDALQRTVRAEQLVLCTDHSGCSEVGGLFLDAAARSQGAGALLARSRYLFLKMHRARFAGRVIAELRGVSDENGSPFWDGVGGRFFGMSFREADEFNAVHGNQFIADLMPKTPIYTAMLSDAARAVLGAPHQFGRPAMRMLEREGFVFDRYVDIFDGGPTMSAATDAIATVAAAREAVVANVADPGAARVRAIVATGRLATFRTGIGHLAVVDDELTLDPTDAATLGIAAGDRVTWVAA